MKVIVSVVGMCSRPEVDWPEGWPIPQVGAEIEIKTADTPFFGTVFVRTVVWHPQGDEETKEPFVYIVVGPQSRQYNY